MTEQKKRGRPAGVKNRVLQPKVSVLSVRREWEKKHAELGYRFECLSDAHRNLAKIADRLQEELDASQKMTVEALAEALRKEGVIRYLEGKVGNQRDNSND